MLIQEHQKGGPVAVREMLRAHSGHTKEIWRILIARAAALNTQNPAHSLTLYRVALVVAEEMRDAGVEATTYYQLGLALSELKRLGEATQALEKSENLFAAARLSRGVAYARADLAALRFVLQKFGEAETYASGALEVVANLKKRAGADGGWPHQYAEAGALSTLGQLRMREGKHRQAEEMVTRALTLYHELDGGSGKYAYEIIESTEAVGRVLFISGNNRRALVHLMRAVDLAQGHPRRDRLASALNSLGVLYLEMEDYDKAAPSLRKSLEIYEGTGDGRECARVLLNLAVIELREKRHAPALALLGEALRRARGAGDRDLVAAALENEGAVRHEQGDYRSAAECYREALASAREVGERMREAEILWRLGETRAAAGDTGGAEGSLRAAIALAREQGFGKLHYLAETSLGLVLLRLGRRGEAVDTLERAVGLAETLRAGAAGDDLSRHLFFGKRLTAYQALVALLVEDGAMAEALSYAERGKARVLRDAFGRAGPTWRSYPARERETYERLGKSISDLNKRIREEAAAPSSSAELVARLKEDLGEARLRLSEFRDLMQASLPPPPPDPTTDSPLSVDKLFTSHGGGRQAVCEYFVTDDKTFLFVIRDGAGAAPVLDVVTIDLTRERLGAEVERLRAAVAGRHPDYDVEARRLYDLLVEPAAHLLRGRESVCVIPDGPLWELPFQALKRPGGGYLIQEYAVSFAPSLQALQTVGRGDGFGNGPRSSLLAFADPAPAVAGGRQSTRLPEARAEVKAIGDSFPVKTVLTGSSASEEAFKRLAEHHGTIHVAAHGVLDGGEPLYSHVLLAVGEGGEEDGLLEAREIADLDLRRAEMVVLSACETARGRFGAGEGVIGLSWAFFLAGCPTVVASQWQVRSDATARLMAGFYSALGPGPKFDKAQAMRRAALSLIRDRRFRHPYYWSGFVVLGRP